MRHGFGLAGDALLAALLTGIVAGTAVAQPRPEDILPPAPAWSGRSERLVARPGDPWITPAERTGLAATPDYAETLAYLQRLDSASPLIRLISFGRTAQGRDLVAAVVSKDPLEGDAPALDPNKPVLLAQAGIHAGEIDGKDAGLMLLRDIALRGKDGLLDRVNLVFVPMFNADGHERTSPYSRPNQRGPASQGWRTNAQNLNINRDWMKLDAPETRAMVALIQRFRPALWVDLHVTDGVDYQYDITYGFEGGGADPARSKAIAAWLNGAYRPAVDKALKAAGHIPGDLVFAVDDRNMAAGLFKGGSPPRFSTGYGDLIHLPTVLVENHSLKPYRQRVLGTYVLLEASLKALARDGAALALAAAEDRAARPHALPAAFTPDAAARGDAAFLPNASETFLSPASGRREVRWLGRAAPATRLPVFGSKAGVTLQRPAAYWVPATEPEVIARLRAHGIGMETLSAPRALEVEMWRARDPELARTAFEGRVGVKAKGFDAERRTETLPAGSVRVSTDQPLGDLAVLLLDPRGDDSFFAWGFFPGMLQRTEYIEGYAIAPLAERMLAADPELKAEFEGKLAADPAFARDPDARLSWFYARTPYYDDRYLLYPVASEPSTK